jgi:hypothetical protein
MQGADLIHGDRRAERRYAFEMPVHFRCLSGWSRPSGSGNTRDLGRNSVLFVTDCPPPRGVQVELDIEWPFLLQNVCPLELRVWGEVFKNDRRGTVVRITKFEFHTCGARSFDQEIAREANWNMVA